MKLVTALLTMEPFFLLITVAISPDESILPAF